MSTIDKLREALSALELAMANVKRAMEIYEPLETRNAFRVRQILKDTVWEYLDGHAIELVKYDIDREIPWYEKTALCQNDNRPRVARGWMNGFPVSLCALCAKTYVADFDRIEWPPPSRIERRA